VQNPFVASAPEAVPAQGIGSSDRLIDVLLEDLPTAHSALPPGPGLPAVRFGALPRSMPARKEASIRFVYFSAANDSAQRALYHQYLIKAEVLLKRVLAARVAGLRAMAPALGHADEARATVRPPRDLFHHSTLEYRRWYDENGSLRPHPLTRESLAALLMSSDGLSREEAKNRATHRSHALAAADQSWLLERRNIALEERPLNERECRTLFLALDGIHETSAGVSHVEMTNRRIAVRAAAVLGVLLDEYTSAPFRSSALNDSFSEHHLAHLRQTIDVTRQAESASGVLVIGPAAWFAAKAARMRAEHQVGLAMSPQALSVMRLSGRPVVAVVGGRLRTFMDGWSPGRLRSSVAFSATAAASAGSGAVGL
jgi:hypothetical protein